MSSGSFSSSIDEAIASPTDPKTQEMASTSTLYALKAGLRKSMLQTLKAIPDGELERQSQVVARIVIDQPFFKRAQTVGCYLSMIKGELQTSMIVSTILDEKKILYTPYLPPRPKQIPNSTSASTTSNLTSTSVNMHMLRLYTPQDLAACPLDKWGILDPGLNRHDDDLHLREDAMDPKSPPLDLILIPGVAFDTNCQRLGRGKAYYDKFLRDYTSTRPRPLLVALALEPQLLPPGQKIPTTEGDFQLDGVVSPHGIVWRDGLDGLER